MADSATELEQQTSPWDRLRRRKVVQWGLLYAAGAWGFLQGLEYVAESFHWPDRVRQVSILALLAGLPIVLVIAWYHGDRGARRVSGTELAIVTLLFLLGGGLFWWYDLALRDPSAPEMAETAVVRSEPASLDSRPSIAVLPFENRSRLADDAFFVDGIHDDILTQLSKISGLKVISRTSVERFRASKLGVQEIANRLGVESVLEGGVQRAGDRVRLNVQLIDAASDAHIWAETYDRELIAANIFAIQTELATSIAGVLKATLTPNERSRTKEAPTQVLEAWEAYQRGKQQMASRTTSGLNQAEKHFRQAIALDSRFAHAYAALADTLRLQTDYSARPIRAGLAEANRMISKALELDPNLAEAWAAQGGIAMSQGDLETAERWLRKAVALNPNNVQAYHWLSMVLRGGDDSQQKEGLKHAERAVQLDPVSSIAIINLGAALESLGRFEDAAERYQRVIDLEPTFAAAYYNLATAYAYGLNRLAEAATLQERAISLDPESPGLQIWLAAIYLELGGMARAEELVSSAIKRWPDEFYSNAGTAVVHQLRGELTAAERHALKALAEYPKDIYSLQILRHADLRRSDLPSARARYADAFPELLSSQPRVDALNVLPAVDLALVLQKMNMDDAASALLQRSESVIQTVPRLGMTGYGIADAQIHALRGDKAKALAALREAAQAGWRGPLWRYYKSIDPNLASIRNEPEFKAIFADIDRDMARQRAALAARPRDAPLDLEATGT